MKPRLFVGSSTESLEIAYALQENLEHISEVTVWTQGIFELSKYTLDSMIDQLDESDFGVFLFTADDISVIRGTEKPSIRDNVVFELGMFIGRIGKERSFIIMPRGEEESTHFPTDLLGITPALYEANRQDGNMCAALGPACSKLSRMFTRLGSLEINLPSEQGMQHETAPEYSEGDKKAILKSWMGSRPSNKNTRVIHFEEVDRELKLKPGTTKCYIKEVATTWGYIIEQEGEHTVLFKEKPISIDRSRSWMHNY